MEAVSLFNNFFPIIDTCLSCEDRPTARQSCAIVPKWHFLRPVFLFPASRVYHISDLHSKFAEGHIMCRSMVDIQSATAEIRRGKKKKIERECGPMPNVMVALPNIGGALCSTPQSLADAHY